MRTIRFAVIVIAFCAVGATAEKPKTVAEAVQVIRSKWLKPKDLVGVPWRAALALQADGWFLRSDIIWHKPNPIPEPANDRPARAHELLFLLSRQPRFRQESDTGNLPRRLSRPAGGRCRECPKS